MWKDEYRTSVVGLQANPHNKYIDVANILVYINFREDESIKPVDFGYSNKKIWVLPHVVMNERWNSG